MCGGRWMRELGSFAASIIAALAGWIFIAPIALLVPKRRDWIAAVGRQHGRFLDNAKYFFLDAASTRVDLRVAFISEDTQTVAAIRAHGFAALHYPGSRGIWFLLRCGSVVVDSTDWERHLRRFLLMRARVVELWHGVAFKRIEIDKWRHETGRYRWLSSRWMLGLRMTLYRFNGRVVHYAVVACTSRFYRDEVFSQAFLAQHFPITGYPRNGFATRLTGSALALAWHNVDASVRARLPAWQAAGTRIVLVAPTMRDSLSIPMRLDAETLGRLDGFAARHGIEFVFKFHPSERYGQQVGGTHLHVCDPASDVYPLLSHCNALVTDYSSIYMDFLLLDRPVLFLIPPDDRYAIQDREVQFDPATMQPGPRVGSWDALLDALATPATPDAYATERARLRRLAFDDLPQGDATAKLLQFMRDERWLP